MLLLQCIEFDTIRRPLGYEGQMIRTAYLYADKVIVSGDTYLTMDFERQHSPDQTAHRKKLIIEHYAKYLNPSADQQAAHVFRTQKEMQERKHKDQATIVMIKRGEKIIHGMYMD